jgi:hypothetical protein
MRREALWWVVDLVFVGLVIWGMFWGTGQTVDRLIVAVRGMLL